MVFSSVAFLFVFLPLVVAGYALLPGTPLRNLFLLVASLLFYAWGEQWFVLVMLASIMVNYVGALLIEHSRPGARKGIIAVTIGANLALLGAFKYADFFAANLNVALNLIGFSIPSPGLALPIGISFFSFQAISYLIEVHRGHVRAERNPLNVALYIAMFPQLVAGPIVRFEKVVGQIHNRRTTLDRASVGTRIFVIGLAQKVLIANEVARVADTAFSGVGPSAVEAWIGLAAYTLQIYFDFAGYSNMAIGLGLVFGFTFPRNFRVPYRSRSVTEFWRRWHISLSTWFRDYLYIPLGGNRHSPTRTYLNLAIVFMLCGLWHGASWTFVIWGVHHGVLLIVERAWLASRLRKMPDWICRAHALLSVMLGWVWFRASDPSHALGYFESLAGVNGMGRLGVPMHLALHPTVIAAVVAGVYFALMPKWGRYARSAIQSAMPRWGSDALAMADTSAVAILLLLSLMAVASGAYSPFLYFRF